MAHRDALRVGDRVVRTPDTFGRMVDALVVRHEPMPGRVVFVHPRGRFHVVAFQTPGGELRECFSGVSRGGGA